MKFRPVHTGELKWPMEYVYNPKNQKLADQLMQLHRNLGDDILIIEEGFPENGETSSNSQ